MRLHSAMELAGRHIRHKNEIDCAVSYGDPGYSDPEGGILFANWNDCPDWLKEGLERRGFNLEWSDEWYISHDTSKAYRHSPDCYSWTPYFVMTEDGEIIGGDEIESGGQSDWYVNEYLLNDPDHCNVFRLDMASFGFVKYDPAGDPQSFETGFHPGQNDSPRKIFDKIRAQYPGYDIVFNLDSKGQFDCGWSAWISARAGLTRASI